MLTSIALADVVADVLGITRESAQLHLKMIRAAGKITFKGYGRAAAAMTPLDASRLVIASAGSIFAKDSIDVLARFAKLVPISKRTRHTATLEESLAQRIAELPMDIPHLERVSPSPEWQQRFGSRRLAETALQLLDPIPAYGETTNQLPRYAILRWLDHRGHSNVLVFGPEWESLDRGTEISDLLDQYSSHGLFQVRIVRRQALVDIAKALK
ncbi:MAG: hypothetical protein WBA62_00350 [Xanthobacteraceae bacterium]